MQSLHEDKLVEMKQEGKKMMIHWLKFSLGGLWIIIYKVRGEYIIKHWKNTIISGIQFLAIFKTSELQQTPIKTNKSIIEIENCGHMLCEMKLIISHNVHVLYFCCFLLKIPNVELFFHTVVSGTYHLGGSQQISNQLDPSENL